MCCFQLVNTNILIRLIFIHKVEFPYLNLNENIFKRTVKPHHHHRWVLEVYV